MGPFVEWIMYDRLVPRTPRTLIEEYVRRNSSRLTPRERSILDSWAASYVGLYEVQRLESARGVELKNLLEDAPPFFVHDITASNQLVQWDVVLARVVEGKRGLEVSGMVSVVPRSQVPALREWMEDQHTTSVLSWPLFLKQNWPAIRRKAFRNSDEWLSGVALQNSDGEHYVLSTSTYQVLDHEAVAAALDALPNMVKESESHYVWLNGPKHEEGHTVLGRMDLTEEGLSVECNSRERLQRAAAFLAATAPGTVSHVRDMFTSQEELKRRAAEAPPRPANPEDEVPPEVAQKVMHTYLDRHYAEWPDQPLPALRGKSPRQAMKTAAGRRSVERLLRDFENGEERNRRQGRPAYDFSRLRAELGLEN